MIDSFDVGTILNAAGWMVLHSVWQITLLWVAIRTSLHFIAQKHMETRYWFMVVGLLCMLGFPGLQMLRSLNKERQNDTKHATAPSYLQQRHDVHQSTAPVPTVGSTPKAEQAVAIASKSPPIAEPLVLSAGGETQPRVNTSYWWTPSFPDFNLAQTYLPVLGIIWLLGSVVTSSRIVFGWWKLQQLRKNSSAIPNRVMVAMVSACEKLGFKRPMGILISRSIDTPSVFGVLKPMIVVPVGITNGLSPAELEMILAHELAHVRRFDLWINALQLIAESLLFYHPCVWWLNQSIRLQREMCCDALAAKTESQRYELGSALLKLESQRSPRTALSLAATDGDLLVRIRALCGDSKSYRSLNAPWGLIMFWIALVGVLVYSANRPSVANDDPPTTAKPATQNTSQPAGKNTSPSDANEPATSASQTQQNAATANAKQRVVFHVAGTVVGPNGQPVENAYVELQVLVRRPAGKLESNPSTYSDKMGRFDITMLSSQEDETEDRDSDFDAKNNWSSFLWVHASEYNVKCVQPFASPNGLLDCAVQLSDATFIPIKVMDVEGKPKSGVHVEPYYFEVPNGVYQSDLSTGLISQPPIGIRSRLKVTTDENGYAELDSVTKQLLSSVSIETDEIAPQCHSLETPSAKLQTAVLRLQPTGKVIGEFVGGTPEIFTDKTIQLESTTGLGPGHVVSRMTCEIDERGRFVANGLMAGNVSTPHGIGWDPNERMQPNVFKDFTLEPNTTEDVQILLSPGTLIRGRLIAEDDKAPVTNALIAISTTRLGVSCGARLDVESDANGEYEAYVAPGVVNVQAYNSSRWPNSARYNYPDLINVVVPPKDGVFPIKDLVFKPYKTEPATLVSSSGKPLPNRRIALITKPHGHAAKIGTTDAEGNVQLTVLYDTGAMDRRITHWVAFPEGMKKGAIDARKLPHLVVKQTTPLILVSEEDE